MRFLFSPEVETNEKHAQKERRSGPYGGSGSLFFPPGRREGYSRRWRVRPGGLLANSGPRRPRCGCIGEYQGTRETHMGQSFFFCACVRQVSPNTEHVCVCVEFGALLSGLHLLPFPLPLDVCVLWVLRSWRALFIPQLPRRRN